MAEQLALFEGAASAFGLVGDSPEIHRVLRIIRKLRNNRSPVLLLGESGTGKELVARALHDVSPGPNGVFVAVNSGALPSTLIESELFGHARGSFTGATATRRGLLEQASGGTLFLDEIGELPLELQTKLLRAVEEKKVRPIGGNHTMPLDLRLIAATNRDLATEVEQGRFRADLFYRLNVISIRLPPLRERREDIPLLVRHFLVKDASAGVTISDRALKWLVGFDWPGNVRQLENCIQKMVALSSGAELDVRDLPTQLQNAAESCDIPSRSPVAPLADVERVAIWHAVRAAQGDRRKAAMLLGIGKTTLYRKLREYGEEPQSTTVP